MPTPVRIALALAAFIPAAAAQQANPPTGASPGTPPVVTPGTPPVVTPAAPPGVTPDGVPGVVATTNNPNLAVATVRLDSGSRLSRIIGAAVQNDAGEQVGTVDDLIMTGDSRVTMAVISVGGFLGLGAKLVAVPWAQLRPEANRVVLPGATKEMLNGMPSLTY